MKSVEIEFYIPIQFSSMGSNEVIRSWYLEARQELPQLVSKAMATQDSGIQVISSRLVDVEDIPSTITDILSPAHPHGFQCLITRCEISLNLSDYSGDYKSYLSDLSSIKLENHLVSMACSTTCDIWNKVMLSILIAKPGSINSDKGYIFYKGKFRYGIDKFYSDLGIPAEDALKDGWPFISSINSYQVYDWMINIPSMEHSLPQGRLGRSISGLNYLVSPHSYIGYNYMEILWTVLALEALYCSGAADLSRQLREKVEVFLGPNEQLKSRINKAYDFRSRLAHGSVDMPLQVCPWDGTKEYSRFNDEWNKSTAFAQSILLATLQKMCLENRYDLNFKYQVVD